MTSSEKLELADGFAGKGDDFYQALLAAHEGLSDQDSAALNARLVLLLANQIGSVAVLREALALARASLRPVAESGDAGPSPASRDSPSGGGAPDDGPGRAARGSRDP